MRSGNQSGWFKYFLGKTWMKLMGWEFEGKLPPQGKFILLCSPHTSNWDFIYLLAIMFMLRIKVSWFGKHTLFKKPFGGLMSWLGGIPVDRRNAHGMVAQIVERFQMQNDLIIAVTPSGTRKRTEFWKSGFYQIAYKAQVPVLLGYADYAKKKAGTGPSFIPTGDIKADMDMIREFYKDIRGAHPEKESTIILREEMKPEG
jgi:1-acyl-sn-glycerol-3-phosphate acyltransferase